MSGQVHSEEGRRILIAGVGNIFFGDDGFGVEVVQRLLARRYPANVEIVDFGIRGVDLAYTLLEDYDELILVDAVSRGGVPGTLYLIEPDRLSAQQSEARESFLDAHSMDPLKVLAFARNMGARPIHTLLVGCEPAMLGNADEELAMGLSEIVQSMIPGAIEMIDLLIDKLSVTSEIILPLALPLKEAHYDHSSS